MAKTPTDTAAASGIAETSNGKAAADEPNQIPANPNSNETNQVAGTNSSVSDAVPADAGLTSASSGPGTYSADLRTRYDDSELEAGLAPDLESEPEHLAENKGKTPHELWLEIKAEVLDLADFLKHDPHIVSSVKDGAATLANKVLTLHELTHTYDSPISPPAIAGDETKTEAEESVKESTT